MRKTIELVKEWGFNKGIMTKSNPLKQHHKTNEEVNELYGAILDGNKVEIADAIGDIIVTLILQAEFHGLDVEQCLNGAYEIISKRTGKMENGIFVKDEAFNR